MENVFKNRNFRLTFFGALVSNVGALLYSFAVSFYILEITDNNAFLQGLYLGICGAVSLIFMPIGGILGDRFHKGRIMFVCDYLKGGVILLATVAMLTLRSHTAHLVILFAVGILGNAIGGVFSPASSALLPEIVEERQLQQANSYFSIMSSLQSIAGVVLAGVLYAALPIHTLFFLVGICFVASGVSEMLIRFDFTPSEGRLTLRLAFTDMREGLRYLRTRKAILALLGAVLFINFFIAPVTGNFLPYFVRTDLANAPSYLLDRVLTPELWSSVFSMSIGLGSLIGAAVLSSRKPAEKCGYTISVRLCFNAAVMIALSLSYWLLVDRGMSLNAFLLVFCAGGFAAGLLLSFINIPISTAIMRIVDRDKLSKVNSIISLGAQGMIPIASVLAGVILQSLGSSPLLAFCSLGFAVTAFLLLINRTVRDM